jgi:hypothetical protein
MFAFNINWRRYNEALQECAERGLDVADVTEQNFATEQMRFNELRKRLAAAVLGVSKAKM